MSKKNFIIFFFSVLAVATLFVIVHFFNRGQYIAVINAEAGMLKGLNREWRSKRGTPDEDLKELLQANGSFKPFLFTNSIAIDNTNHFCQFGVEVDSFGRRGILAITTNDIVIWIGSKDGTRIVHDFR